MNSRYRDMVKGIVRQLFYFGLEHKAGSCILHSFMTSVSKHSRKSIQGTPVSQRAFEEDVASVLPQEQSKPGVCE